MRVFRALPAVLLALCLICAASVGRAQLAAVPQAGPAATELAQTAAARNTRARRMVVAYRDWLTRWQVPNAAMVIMVGDRVVGRAQTGSYRIGQRVPLASLSKAITAICIARLVEDGQVRFDTPLGEPLHGYLQQNPPADGRVPGITLAQLLTHSSGITNDLSQGFPLNTLPSRPDARSLANVVLSSPLGSAPGSTYFYNSMNYLLLGMVIESVTGQSYMRACSNRVLAPIGINRAGFDPDWRILWSFGGWQMSVRDYARFLAYYDPTRSLLSIPQEDWPRFDMGSGISYTLGAQTRMRPPGLSFYHSGHWDWPIPPYVTSHSARFVTMGPSLRYVTAEAPNVSSAARADLDSVMWAAAFPARFAQDAATPPDPESQP